jgi:hypothetical protein
MSRTRKKATTPSLTPAPARYTMQFLPFVCAVETRWSADRNNRETVDTTRREKDWFNDATVGPAGNRIVQAWLQLLMVE